MIELLDEVGYTGLLELELELLEPLDLIELLDEVGCTELLEPVDLIELLDEVGCTEPELDDE